MAKRFLSFITALIITLTALSAVPLTAYAEPAESTEPNTAETSSPSPTEATESEPTEEPTEGEIEPTIIDCPVITDIQNQSGGVQITWDTYQDNQIYRIYYRRAAVCSGSWEMKYSDGDWTRLATVRGNSYLHTAVKDAEIGIYTVRCVDEKGDFTSDFNPKGWENCYYAAPQIKTIRFDTEGIHLNWELSWQKHGCWNGETYRVYRKTAGEGWTRLCQTADDHYTDPTAEIGVTYYYTVRMTDSTGARFLSDYESSSPISFNAYPYVSAIDNAERGAKLSWYPYSGASSYRVYYRSADGWTRIAQVSGTTYTDTSAKNAEERVYTVRALNANNDFISDFNSDGWSNIFYAPPVIDELSSATEGVKLNWKRSDGAQLYRVYRKTTGGWQRIAQTDGCEYTDTDVKSGTAYTYTLRMITADGERFMSDYLSGKKITYVAAPIITDAENQTDGVKLTWEPVKGADFYRIYYKTDDGWKRLASKYLTEYIDTSVKDGETREYTIRCLDEKENFVSDFYRDGKINTFHKPPVIQSLTGSDNGVTITWDRAEGAEDYRVYRKTVGSSWQLLTQTADSSYTDTEYENGTFCYYTLRIIKADGSRFMSDYVSSKKFVWCDTPRFSALQDDTNGVKLSWDAVKGADQYRVYCRDESGWNRLCNVRGNTTYTDTSVKDGETRIYTIRCVNADGDFISDFDSSGTVHTYRIPAAVKSVSYQDNACTVSWSACADASAYRLYRKTLGDSEWTMIADRIDNTAYTDDSAAEKGIYAYHIRSLDENGDVIDSVIPAEIYYQKGARADGSFTISGVKYYLSSGRLVKGYYIEKGTTSYYRGGVRVAQDWFETGKYAGLYDRTRWLYELMTAIGEQPQVSRTDAKAVFDLALERGVIDSYSEEDFTRSVDRRYAANTIFNALDYPSRNVGNISDLRSDDTALNTLVYYGYFQIDSKDRVFPTATVTSDEFDKLLSQLNLYRKLKGKNVISFGDSIMHGCGNSYRPISHMLAEKYGMNCYDYSHNGSTMGQYSDKSHIPDQVRKAISYHHQPDIILIDGGTNDMYHEVAMGSIKNGYDMSNANESTFSGGFETAMWLINNTWKDVPVIYIRAHDMDLGEDSSERAFGERGLAIADKWHAAGIDLYNDSSMNTEKQSICDRYTYPNPEHYYEHDSIHPNALGYATYYIPPIEKMMAYTL